MCLLIQRIGARANRSCRFVTDSKDMRVLKFGGTSVGSADRINEVIDIIEKSSDDQIIVLSAMSGTTNDLVEISNALATGDRERSIGLLDAFEQKYIRVLTDLYIKKDDRDLARDLIRPCVRLIRAKIEDTASFGDSDRKEILAQGELISTRLFAHMCDIRDVPAKLIPALNFMSLNKDEDPDLDQITNDIKPYLELLDEDCSILITQGYICKDAGGHISNLRRGGSDYTATIIGAVTQAEEVQIWTDIDGVRNNDPRLVEDTEAIRQLSYREAAELAYFGAKILHPTCVLPVEKSRVPLRLKCTMQPDAEGTLISDKKSERAVTALAAKDHIIALEIRSHRMLNAYGFLTRVFKIFEDYRTPVDMITTSEVSVSLTIDDSTHLDQIIASLEDIAEVDVSYDQAIVCIVGNSLYEEGYSASIFDLIKDIQVRMVSMGGSRYNISLLVAREDKVNALIALNQLFQLTPAHVTAQ